MGSKYIRFRDDHPGHHTGSPMADCRHDIQMSDPMDNIAKIDDLRNREAGGNSGRLK